MARMTACNTNVALNDPLQDLRRLWRRMVPRKRVHNQRRTVPPVSVGVAVVGGLEGIADDTAHSAREWSDPDAVGWAM